MVVSAGDKRLRTVSAEAEYDGQSLQEAKISGLVYTLCYSLRELLFIEVILMLFLVVVACEDIVVSCQKIIKSVSFLSSILFAKNYGNILKD